MLDRAGILARRAGERGEGERWSTYCLNEVLQAELDRQAVFPHTTVSQHYQLVQHHFARHGESDWLGSASLGVKCSGSIGRD